jgi:hypothetical protein
MLLDRNIILIALFQTNAVITFTHFHILVKFIYFYWYINLEEIFIINIVNSFIKVKMYSCKQTNIKTHEIKLLSITMCYEFLFKIHSKL